MHLFIEKQAEDPSPFRGGDECRTLFSHSTALKSIVRISIH